jgi:hypothetical protein
MVIAFIVIAPGDGYCDIQFVTTLPHITLPPTINVTPNPVYVGQTLTVTGSNFNTTPYPGDAYPMAAASVGSPVKIQSDGTFIIQTSFTGPGTIQVYAMDKWGHTSNTVNLTILAAPNSSSATPSPTAQPSTPTPTQSPTTIATPTATISPGTPDTAAPVTTLSLTGVNDPSGAFTSNVVCTLTAANNGSGVNKTLYSFDGNNWTLYTGPFTISNPGNTTVFYRSEDHAGNQEVAGVKVITITVSASATASGQPSAGYSLLLPLLAIGLAGIYGIRKWQK